MSMRGLVYVVAMMAMMCDSNFLKMGDISEKYSGPVTKSKIKNNFNSSKTSYQNPQVKKQKFYHNKTIPQYSRNSRKSYLGKEQRAENIRVKIRKNLESKF